MHHILGAEWACSRKARGYAAARLKVGKLDQMGNLVGSGCDLVPDEYDLFSEDYELRCGGKFLAKYEVMFGDEVLVYLRMLFEVSQPPPALQPVCIWHQPISWLELLLFDWSRVGH